MNYAAVRALTAGLLLSGAALIQAQSPEPSRVLRVFPEDIKSGKTSAHEKVESAYVRAFSKSGYPGYLGLDSTAGTSQALGSSRVTIPMNRWKKPSAWPRPSP